MRPPYVCISAELVLRKFSFIIPLVKRQKRLFLTILVGALDLLKEREMKNDTRNHSDLGSTEEFIKSWVQAGHKRDYSYGGNHLPKLSVKSASIETLFLPEEEGSDEGQG